MLIQRPNNDDDDDDDQDDPKVLGYNRTEPWQTTYQQQQQP